MCKTILINVALVDKRNSKMSEDISTYFLTTQTTGTNYLFNTLCWLYKKYKIKARAKITFLKLWEFHPENNRGTMENL